MAIVQGINLATIKALGKAVTFSHDRGRTIARIHMPKLGPNRSPAVKIQNTRFRSCTHALHQLSASIINTLRAWAKPSDYTWKDQLYSLFLKAWATDKTCPVFPTDFTATRADDQINLTFSFANWHATQPYGYGRTPYGRSPYGDPSGALEPDGIALHPPYKITFGRLIPWPRLRFHKSPQSPTGCAPPVIPTTTTTHTPATSTPDPTPIYVALIEQWTRPGAYFCHPTDVIAAQDTAWAKFLVASWVSYEPPIMSYMWHIIEFRDELGWCALFFAVKNIYEIKLSNYITAADWWKVKQIEISINVDEDPGIRPFAYTAVAGGITITPKLGDNLLVIPNTFPYTPTLLVNWTNNYHRPYNLTGEDGRQSRSKLTTSGQIVYRAIQPPSSGVIPELTPPPYTLFLTPLGNVPPIPPIPLTIPSS